MVQQPDQPADRWRTAQLPVIVLLVCLPAFFLGMHWVGAFLDVRTDTLEVGRGDVEYTPSTPRDGFISYISVYCGREPGGMLWRERISVTAYNWEPRAPGQLNPPVVERVPLPAAGVKLSPVPGSVVRLKGRALWTTVTADDVAAAVRAGGSMVRPCPGGTAIIIKAALGGPIMIAALAGCAWAPPTLMRNARMERRRQGGYCPSCGYDLRGTGMCPECGPCPRMTV